jgi:hypothetical protein
VTLPRGAIALALLIGAGCERGPKNVTIDDRAHYWEKNGFTELVPAIRAPSTADERDVVHVWIKLPEGARVTAIGGSLRVPPGTIADRVETRGEGGVDVRGTRFDAREGELFHVFHSDAKTPSAPVSGWEWPRSDEKLGQQATDKLVASLAGQPPGEIEALRQFNQCVRCHEHDTPAVKNAAERRPRRRTDGSGLFELLAVLEDEAPPELNRPRDMNVGAPFVTVHCGAADPELRTRPDGARHYACADGTAPVARLDVAAALAAGDAHAVAVCASRRFLFDHMDAAARAAFAQRFAACGIAAAAPKG